MNEYKKYCFECKIAKLKDENEDLFWKLKSMQGENERLKKQNSDIQNSHMKLYNDTKDEIRELKAENERLRKKCGEVPFEECDFEYDNELDVKALIIDLQDQHQQDCIRYNDMRTAFLKAVDELALLRKQFGVGQ